VIDRNDVAASERDVVDRVPARRGRREAQGEAQRVRRAPDDFDQRQAGRRGVARLDRLQDRLGRAAGELRLEGWVDQRRRV
jgi:hypothetical protein